MNTKNYSRTISVNTTPDKVYQALTADIEHWWTKPDAPLTSVGDQAKFTFRPGKTFWIFEATQLQPGKRVEMQCVKALHLHDAMPKVIEQEWLGTKVIWEIILNGSHTDIRIEHIGLVPSLHCYEICEAGWDMFFVDSLKLYLNTGVGKPHQKPNH